MYLWRRATEDFNENGMLVSFYDTETKRMIDFFYTAKFPNIEVCLSAYYLREDFILDERQYNRAPTIFQKEVKRAFEESNFDALQDKLYDRIVYPYFLQHGNIAKTKNNLQDLGHTFH